jgi:hypothetical protein
MHSNTRFCYYCTCLYVSKIHAFLENCEWHYIVASNSILHILQFFYTNKAIKYCIKCHTTYEAFDSAVNMYSNPLLHLTDAKGSIGNVHKGGLKFLHTFPNIQIQRKPYSRQRYPNCAHNLSKKQLKVS